jgi:protein-disulfide isomerase
LTPGLGRRFNRTYPLRPPNKLRAQIRLRPYEEGKLVKQLSTYSPRARMALSTITLALALSPAAACSKSQGPGKAAAAKASPTSCADYAARVCKEGGEESGNCTTIKAATELLAPEACAVALTNVSFTIKKLGEQKKKCEELVTKLCGDLGAETGSCEMVKTQTKTFTPDRCALMMQHYPEVLSDLKQQEDRMKPLDEEKRAKIAGGAVPAFGPDDAKVTIVEFSDFECPFCSRAAEITHKVKEKYGDKVRFVFRQFPLSFHKNAHTAAEASLAAHSQGKFWEFHDKLFANQQKLDRASLDGFAKELGLNVASFKKALDSKEFAPAVDAEMKLGEEVTVQGTPSMFINGARIADPTNFEVLSGQIDAALAKAGT